MKNHAEAIASMIQRTEMALTKFTPGTAQHSLLTNRLQALEIAGALIAADGGVDDEVAYDQPALEKAEAPLTSLLTKSTKSRTKVKAGSWQHKMLDENIAALERALALLTDKLESEAIIP